MDNIDVSSYTQKGPPVKSKTKQNKTVMRSTNPPSIPTRQTLVPKARHETVFRAPIIKVPQRLVSGDLRLPNVPVSNYASQSRTISTSSSNYGNRNTNLRSLNSSFAPSSLHETKSDKSLRDELIRLRTSFDVYCKDSNAKIQSIMATNVSLMEDLCDLKAQLNLMTSKFTGSNTCSRCISGSSKLMPVKEVNSDNLLNDLSAKLLESPEFKQKVIDLIEEHDFNETDKLIKPPLQSPFRNDALFNSTHVKDFASPKPTIIRDETFVMLKDNDKSLELTRNTASPFRANQSRGLRTASPEISHFEQDAHQSSGVDENESNGTFVILSDDEDDLQEKRSSSVVQNRPFINASGLSAAGSNNSSPSNRRKSISWTVDMH